MSKHKKHTMPPDTTDGPGSPPRTGAPHRPPFFRRADVWVILALLLAAGIWLAAALLRGPGQVAHITIGTGDAQRTETIRLDRDGTHHIEADLPVTLEVKDGAIRFVHSVCPDHTCEGFGWLRAEGDWALCAPAAVMVRVQPASGQGLSLTL